MLIMTAFGRKAVGPPAAKLQPLPTCRLLIPNCAEADSDLGFPIG